MQMNQYVIRIFLHGICRSLDALPYDKVAITPKIEKPPPAPLIGNDTKAGKTKSRNAQACAGTRGNNEHQSLHSLNRDCRNRCPTMAGLFFSWSVNTCHVFCKVLLQIQTFQFQRWCDQGTFYRPWFGRQNHTFRLGVKRKTAGQFTHTL